MAMNTPLEPLKQLENASGPARQPWLAVTRWNYSTRFSRADGQCSARWTRDGRKVITETTSDNNEFAFEHSYRGEGEGEGEGWEWRSEIMDVALSRLTRRERHGWYVHFRLFSKKKKNKCE